MATQSTQATPLSTLPTNAAQAPDHPHPLVAVLKWEVRRALASRAIWLMAALLFGVCLLILGFSSLTQDFSASATFSAAQTPAGVPVQHTVSGSLTRNSLWGLAILLPITLLEFGLFLPFVTADGVSLDLKRRTHELLMTTSLPSWAYVWGRYLVGMLITLGMACVFLLAILTMALALHLTQGDVYPSLDLPGAVAIWAVVVLPPALLLSSLSFALGVLLPRRSNLIKVGMVLAWFVSGTLLPGYLFDQVRHVPAFVRGNPPVWWTAYETWEPTNIPAGALFMRQFVRHLSSIVDNVALSNQAVQQQAHALERQMPDLAPLAGPHLIWVAVGLAAVVAASLSFRRFRDVAA
jgi:ABC-type transport system involved in multi-copper enzyme maturation permease subunit